jgi:hypothetical protein
LVRKYEGKAYFEARRYEWEDKKLDIKAIKMMVWNGLNWLWIRLS